MSGHMESGPWFKVLSERLEKLEIKLWMQGLQNLFRRDFSQVCNVHMNKNSIFENWNSQNVTWVFKSNT